ncbi:hypothetical protein ARALYDRAFT_916190 [Arabidopsis lyrata subsp. lyrata]|uniref:Cathepsin propeptide inhibitor domain-containing protein n=1 Tax=Arabidopsis lyrata subsp. lyrata TaxID=81972 RepID=D7MJ72_ARALL|nr:hypothetical protein ARALYDRAFT_916190 [Arabidopsis lyrata subsp. lyrata]
MKIFDLIFPFPLIILQNVCGFDFHEKEVESEESLLTLYNRCTSHHFVHVNNLDLKENRFEIFRNNARYILNSNKKGRPYTLGLNQFVNMKHNGFLPMYKCATVRIDQTLPGSNMFMHEDMDQVPNSFDWKERSVVTDVKNQESECAFGRRFFRSSRQTTSLLKSLSLPLWFSGALGRSRERVCLSVYLLIAFPLFWVFFGFSYGGLKTRSRWLCFDWVGSVLVMGLLGSQWMVGVFVGARVVLHYYGCCFWRWRIGGWLAAEVSWPPFSRFLLLLPRFLWISWLSFVDFGVVVALSSYSSLKR